MITEALILAGGKGTRLSKVLKGNPKPLVEIGGIPLLKHQINLLLSHGVKKIYLLVNYKSNLIKNFLQKEFNHIDYQILDDGKKALGTGGSILKHLHIFDKTFFVLYGDTFLNVNLNEFFNFHKQKLSDLTLFAHPNTHPFDSDVLICDSNEKVIGISGYPHDKSFYSSNLVNAALYVVEKKMLQEIPKLNKILIDFAKDIIPLYISKANVFAYKSREYIKDCGTEARLKKVESDFKAKRHLNLAHGSFSPAIFLDRDGTIIENIDHLNSINDIKFIQNSIRAINSFNSNDFFVAITTNQPVIARGELSVKNLKRIHDYIEWELGKEGAFVDEILFCPHHPDSGFPGEIKDLKIKCKCRKPGTEMLKILSEKFNLNLEKSWIIGDTTSDVKCGNDFNIKSILIETGIAGKDNKFYCEPDYIFSDLHEASIFINKTYPKLLQIFDNLNIEKGQKNIFISGISKSGKSTLSSALKDYVQNNFKSKCHIIRIDDFMLDKKDRHEFPHIYDDEINEIIKKRFNNKSFKFLKRRYNKFTNTINYSEDKIYISSQDYIIFDGLIAYDLSKEFFRKNQFYIECLEHKVKERFIKDYVVRGYTNENISKIYKERYKERIIIKKQKKQVNIIKL
tara:strand:- start:12314 stop:14188 length:1875 start_codon:yes stop_codon:yes gene_type:complete